MSGRVVPRNYGRYYSDYPVEISTGFLVIKGFSNIFKIRFNFTKIE